MRFTFTNGGRSGCRTAEALADYMEGFATREPPHSGAFMPHRIVIFESGNMFLDLSAGFNGPGQIFREAGRLRLQIIKALAQDKEMRQALRDLALSYWAEGEAILLDYTTKPNNEGKLQRL